MSGSVWRSTQSDLTFFETKKHIGPAWGLTHSDFSSSLGTKHVISFWWWKFWGLPAPFAAAQGGFFWSFTFKNPNSAATAEFSLSEFQLINSSTWPNMETSVAISVTPKIGWLIPMINPPGKSTLNCVTRASEMVQPRFRWKTKQTIFLEFIFCNVKEDMEKWYPTFWLFLPEVSKIRHENIWKPTWWICFLVISATQSLLKYLLHKKMGSYKMYIAQLMLDQSKNCCKLHLGESLQVHNQSLLPVFTQINDLGLGIISTFSWAVAFSRCTHQGEPRWTPHRFDPFWSAVAVPTIVRVAAEKHGGAWWPMRWISAKP